MTVLLLTVGQTVSAEQAVEQYRSIYVDSLHLQGVIEDQKFKLVASYDLAEGYHIYWQNPGDSGTAPRFQLLEQPDGADRWVAGSIEWPAPEKILTGPLVTYGYSERVDLRLTLWRGAQAVDVRTPPEEELIVEIKWLVCRIECLPESARLRYRPELLTTEPAAIERLSPLPDNSRQLQLSLEPVSADGASDPRAIALALPSDSLWATTAGADWHFAPFDAGLTEPAAQQTLWYDDQQQRWYMTLEAGLEFDRLMSDDRASLGGLLMMMHPAVIDREHPELAQAKARAVYPVLLTLPASASQSTEPTIDGGWAWLLAALFALLGGLLLNVMPCVFPVMSIKLVALVDLANQPASRGHLVAAVVAQTAGIVLTMLLLAGGLLLFRGTEQPMGWGFQLQSPLMVLAMSGLLLLVALNFSGAFEISLPMAALSRMASRPVGMLAGYFMSGLLLVLLASPCTAPFMVLAFSYAWQQSAPIALSIFVFLGLGLALPYLILLPFPKLLDFLPRPGPWLEHTRRILAFPIYATVLWLIWLLSQLIDAPDLARGLTVLWLMGLGAWCYGRFMSSGRQRIGGWLLGLLLLSSIGWLVGGSEWSKQVSNDQPSTADVSQLWSEDKVEQLRRQGRAVLINFTAAWCVTCVWNEKTVFSRSEFNEALVNSKTTLLVADWTRHDQTIARALAGYGRFSVPTYVYYPPVVGSQPVLLSQLPNLTEMIALLNRSDSASTQPVRD